uniref:SCAN box domain-containing protein n=1 Tax=Laticauda laticaudata TaxID=8630 RepID=A0A8C5SJF4_LATLA
MSTKQNKMSAPDSDAWPPEHQATTAIKMEKQEWTGIQTSSWEAGFPRVMQVGTIGGYLKEPTPQEPEKGLSDCWEEAEGPREAFCRLGYLCHQWLKPEKHTKEQILDLLILEHFLTILPPDMQSWVKRRHPETCSQAVALAEDFLLKQQENKRQIVRKIFDRLKLQGIVKIQSPHRVSRFNPNRMNDFASCKGLFTFA